MAKPLAERKYAYAVRILLIGALFVPLNLAALVLMGYTLTWQMVGVTVGVLAAGALFLILATGKPSKAPNS